MHMYVVYNIVVVMQFIDIITNVKYVSLMFREEEHGRISECAVIRYEENVDTFRATTSAGSI